MEGNYDCTSSLIMQVDKLIIRLKRLNVQFLRVQQFTEGRHQPEEQTLCRGPEYAYSSSY